MTEPDPKTCLETHLLPAARRRLAGTLCLIAALCAAAFLLPASVHAAAQPAATGLAQYVQTAITSRNGLPQNSVLSIAQSSDGYIWLATEEGLVRYDGNRSRVFDRRSDPILHDNVFDSVSAARDGSVWGATRSSVYHYRDGAFVSQTTAPGKGIRVVLADDAGNVWVGSSNGIFTVSADGSTLDPFSPVDSHTGVNTMELAGDGSIWVAASSGLWHIQGMSAHRYGASQGLPEANITAVTAAPDGSLWIASDTELLHWQNGGVLSRTPLQSIVPHCSITALLVDGADKLWIGLDQGGIATLKGDVLEHIRSADGLPSDNIFALHRDRDDNVWVGFNGGGVLRFHSGLFHTYGDREGLSDKGARNALAARDGSVWTVAARLVNHLRTDRTVEILSGKDGLPPAQIYSMFEDTDGSVWMGNNTGDLLHVEANPDGSHHIRVFHNPRHDHDRLSCILRGPGNALFVLYRSQLGLERFSNGIFTVEPHNIPGETTIAARAPDGSLWIGTNHGGIAHWNERLLQLYGPRQGFAGEYVYSLAVDRDGYVWAGNTPDGLSLIRNGRISRFSPDDGLFDYTVGSLTADLHGYFWIASNKGMYKVSRQELLDVADGRARRVHSIVYGLPEGMRSAECNYGTSPSVSMSPDGNIWFATTEGLAAIRPSASTIRTSTPQAIIEATRVDGVPVGVGSIQTSVGIHDLEFDFAAPDFAAPERLNFRYRLNGFDRTWIDAGHRPQAFYTRLPPGQYTLLVEAEDGNGWSARPAVLYLRLPPHFWQTVWFRIVAFLVFLLVGYLGYEWRVFALRRSSRVLQEQVVVRTAELQDAMREAEAAHHELQELATRDSMTRLWNRRHILNMLRNEANRAERENLSLCVLMLDVDHFKSVNDSKGHLAGDRALQTVSNVLIDQTRPYDCAGRYGGEEFLVILCNCSLENGVKRANMIRSAIATSPVEWNGATIDITASFGVALHHPGKTIEAVLQEADEALYRAKQNGRNRVCTSLDLPAAEPLPRQTPLEPASADRGHTTRHSRALGSPRLNPA